MAATRAEEAETSFGDRGTATTASGLDGDQKIAETDIVRALDPIRRSLWSGFRLHIEVGSKSEPRQLQGWCVVCVSRNHTGWAVLQEKCVFLGATVA